PAAGGGEQPADGERLPAVGAHLDRDLVGRSPDAPGPHLDLRHDVVERLPEDGERVLLGLGLDYPHGTIDDRLGDRLLALVHHRVHELGDHIVLVFRIGDDLAFFGTVATGHLVLTWLLLFASSWPGSSRPLTSFSLHQAGRSRPETP